MNSKYNHSSMKFSSAVSASTAAFSCSDVCTNANTIAIIGDVILASSSVVVCGQAAVRLVPE